MADFTTSLGLNIQDAERKITKLTSILKKFKDQKTTSGIYRAIAALAVLNKVIASTPKSLLVKFDADTKDIEAAKQKIAHRVDKGIPEPKTKMDKEAARFLNLNAQKTEESYSKINSHLIRSDKSIKRINNSVKTQNSLLTQASKKYFGVDKIISRMSFVMTAMLSWSVLRGVQNAVTENIKNVVDFESAISSVFTLLDESDKHFKGLITQNVLDSMEKYGENIDTTSRAMYDILSARVSPDWAGYVLDTAMQGAVAGFTDVRTAGDALTTVLNSYEMQAYQAGDVMDWFFQVIKYGKTTLEELQPNIGKVTSSAALLGINLEEVGAALSSMTQAGLQTNVAITSLRQLFTTLSAPTDKAKKIFEKYNIQLDIATVKKEGLGYAIKQLQGLTEEEIVTIAKSRRGFQALAVALGNNKTYLENYHNMQKRSMATFNAYLERANTLEFRLKQLKSAQTTLNISTLDFARGAGAEAIQFLTLFVKYLKEPAVIIPALGLTLFALKDKLLSATVALKKFLVGVKTATLIKGFGVIAAIGILITVLNKFKIKAEEADQAYEKWIESIHNNTSNELKHAKSQLQILESMRDLSQEEIKNLGIKDRLDDKYKDLDTSTSEYTDAIEDLKDKTKELTEKEQSLYEQRRSNRLMDVKKDISSYENAWSNFFGKQHKLKISLLDTWHISTLAMKDNLSEDYFKGIIEQLVKLDDKLKNMSIEKAINKTAHFRLGRMFNYSLEELQEFEKQINDTMVALTKNENENAYKVYIKLRRAIAPLKAYIALRKEQNDIQKELNEREKEEVDELEEQRQVLLDRINNWKSKQKEAERESAWGLVEQEFDKLIEMSQKGMEKDKENTQKYKNYITSAYSDIYEAQKGYYEKNIKRLEVAVKEEDLENKKRNKNSVKARKAYIEGLKQWLAEINRIEEEHGLTLEQRKEKLSVLGDLNTAQEPFESTSGLKQWQNNVKKVKEEFKNEEASISDVKAAYDELLAEAEKAGKTKTVLEEIRLEEKIFVEDYEKSIEDLRNKLSTLLEEEEADFTNSTKIEQKKEAINSLEEQISNYNVKLAEANQNEKKELKEIIDNLITAKDTISKFGIEGEFTTEQEKMISGIIKANSKAIDLRKQIEDANIESTKKEKELLDLVDQLQSIMIAKSNKELLETNEEKASELIKKLKRERDEALATQSNQTTENKAIAALDKQKQKYTDQLNAIGNISTKTKEEISGIINEWYEAELAGIRFSNKTLPILNKSVADFNEELKASPFEIGKMFSSWANFSATLLNNNPLSTYDELIKQTKQDALDATKIIKGENGELIAQDSKGEDALDKIKDYRIEKEKARNQKIVEANKFVVGQLTSIWNNYLQQREARIQRSYEKDMEALQEKADAEHRSSLWLKKEQDKIEEEKLEKEKELNRQKKEMDITKVIISTSVAIAKAYELGPIKGIIYAAIMAALGAKQVAQIEAQKFAKGGLPQGAILGGKPHSQGGTQFIGSDGTVFEAEKGELLAVINKKSTSMLQALSDINELGGGRSFFSSGGIKMANGGAIEPDRRVSVINNDSVSTKMLEELINKIDKMETKVEINAKTLTDLDIVKKVRNGQRRERRYG